MTTVIVVLGAFLYFVVAGVMRAKTIKAKKRVCRGCRKADDGVLCRRHEGMGAAVGAFWPVSLPLIIGNEIGYRDKVTKLEQQRERELEEARHQTALAAEARRQAEEINRQLVANGQADLVIKEGK